MLSEGELAHMDRYIEVIGEAVCFEAVTLYRLEFTLTAEAKRVEDAITQASEVKSACIQALLARGLPQECMSEGGDEISRHLAWNKKTEVMQRILIEAADLSKVAPAISSLGPLLKNSKCNVSLSARKPRFEARPEDKSKARFAAIEDAREKASDLAAALGISLGAVVQVEQLPSRIEKTGAFGDDTQLVPAFEGESLCEIEPAELPGKVVSPTRAVTTLYRVRFELRAHA